MSACLGSKAHASPVLRNASPTLLVVALALALSCSGDPAGPRTPTVWASISAGNAVTCALTPTGAAYCWGANTLGELGDGTTEYRSTPTPVAGAHVFTSLATGRDHVCAVDSAGAAYCWGYNASGQLGDGSTANRTSPTAVSGGLVFLEVAPGMRHSCGVATSGAAYCWGSNAYGQLGDGTTTDRLTPALVAGGIAFQSIATGGMHSCGLTGSGTTYCWGRNDFGQLGDSSTSGRLTPVRVAGGLTFQSLTLGDYHSCGVTAAGLGYCWGEYCCGQLGVGVVLQNDSVITPRPIVGGLTFRSVTAFWAHTCGVTTSDYAYCWGSDIGNLIGTGPLGYFLAEPTAVVGAPLLKCLATGTTHSCGLTASGSAYCWGLKNDPLVN